MEIHGPPIVTDKPLYPPICCVFCPDSFAIQGYHFFSNWEDSINSEPYKSQAVHGDISNQWGYETNLLM